MNSSFLAYGDLQLAGVIGPDEELAYSHEKSESTIMRESLSPALHGSWVCIQRQLRKERNYTGIFSEGAQVAGKAHPRTQLNPGTRALRCTWRGKFT